MRRATYEPDPSGEGWRLELVRFEDGDDSYRVEAVCYELPADRHAANRLGPLPTVRIVLEHGDRRESVIPDEMTRLDPGELVESSR